MIHHFTRATRHLIFWSLIAVALGMTGMRMAMVGIEGYKARLAAHIGALVGVPVKIGRLGARMRGFNPEVVLHDIDIASSLPAKQSAVELKEIRFGIHLIKAVLSRDLLASSWATLVGAKLTVKRNSDGKLSIAGLKAGEENPLWLLETGKYEVIASEITWQDEQRHGRPLKFESVDFALINEGDRHRLNVLMRLPKKLGRSLRAALDVTGDLFDLKALQGRAYLEGSAINLPEWVTFDLPSALTVVSGSGDLKLWSQWQNAQMTALSGRVDLQDLSVERPGVEPLRAEQLSSRFRWRQEGDAWQLSADRLALTTSAGNRRKEWPEIKFSVKHRMPAEGRRQIALFAERLDLQEAALLARFGLPADTEWAAQLRAAEPKGELSDFALFADSAQNTFALQGDFHNVGWAPLGAWPGFEGLSGHVHGNHTHTAVQVTGRDAMLTAPGLFRKALPLTAIDGELRWRRNDTGWTLESPLLTVVSQGLDISSRLRFEQPAGGEPLIDLQSAFSCTDASKAHEYLPVSLMRPDVVAWLDGAFLKGRVPKGGFLLYGAPGAFPFKDGDGVFEVLFDVEGMELMYLSQWPHVADLGAEVLFYRDNLSANVRSGKSEGVTIREASVEIPRLNAADNLLITGHLEGGIDQALAFIAASPLAARAERFLQEATPKGSTTVDLDLDLPLRTGGQYRTDVTAHFENAELYVKSPDVTVSNVSGSVKFDEQGVEAEQLSATVLKRPVKADVSAQGSRTVIDVRGRADAAELRKEFGWSWLDFAKGETRYQLSLNLPQQNGTPTLTVRSDLEGMRMDLPDTLAKTAGASRQLSVAVDLTESASPLPVSVDYGGDFNAKLAVDKRKGLLSSGHIVLGEGKAAVRRDPGVQLEVNRDRVQLADWLALAGGQATGATPALDVRQVTLHAAHGLWGENDIGDFRLDLERHHDAWQGRIDSPLLRGRVDLPSSGRRDAPIALRLERLDLSKLAELEADKSQGAANKSQGSAKHDNADTLPLLSVASEHTLWKSADLGRLLLSNKRLADGMAFDRIELKGEHQLLTASGRWQNTPKISETNTKGRLELTKGSRLFSVLGISDDLIDSSGTIAFDLSWPGAPYSFALTDVRGTAEAKLNSGRILSIEPGFGRVLGILAMAQWFKRLQLDFRDVYQEGLSFNNIKGNFTIAQGKAVTDDLIVDAIPAKIAINGETDFVKRTVDYLVHVTPKSAEAVPIAGTIMSKFASLIDKTITGSEHEGFFFGSQYLIEGEWGNTTIRTLHDKEGLLQKTWTGITEFPWLLNDEE